ncbi:hypothetical protein WDU94_001662 [Cyamophila willieti]
MDSDVISKSTLDVVSRNDSEVISNNGSQAIRKNDSDVTSKNDSDVVSKNESNVISQNDSDVISKNSFDVVSRNDSAFSSKYDYDFSSKIDSDDINKMDSDDISKNTFDVVSRNDSDSDVSSKFDSDVINKNDSDIRKNTFNVVSRNDSQIKTKNDSGVIDKVYSDVISKFSLDLVSRNNSGVISKNDSDVISNEKNVTSSTIQNDTKVEITLVANDFNKKDSIHNDTTAILDHDLSVKDPNNKNNLDNASNNDSNNIIKNGTGSSDETTTDITITNDANFKNNLSKIDLLNINGRENSDTQIENGSKVNAVYSKEDFDTPINNEINVMTKNKDNSIISLDGNTNTNVGDLNLKDKNDSSTNSQNDKSIPNIDTETIEDDLNVNNKDKYVITTNDTKVNHKLTKDDLNITDTEAFKVNVKNDNKNAIIKVDLNTENKDDPIKNGTNTCEISNIKIDYLNTTNNESYTNESKISIIDNNSTFERDNSNGDVKKSSNTSAKASFMGRKFNDGFNFEEDDFSFKDDDFFIEDDSYLEYGGFVDDFDLAMISYLTYEEITTLIQHMEIEYKQLVKVHSIGKSGEGRDIWAVQITENVQKERPLLKPMFKYVANIHGDEAVGYALMVILIQYLVNLRKAAKVKSLLEKFDIYIIPTMNPDGFVRSKEGQCDSLKNETGKLNAAGVDLNQNFPDRYEEVTEEKYEPETKALMKLIQENPFVMSVHLKSEGQIGVSYPYDSLSGNKKCCRKFTTDWNEGCCIESQSPDDELFHEMAQLYSEKNSMMTSPYKLCKNYFSPSIVNENIKGGMQDFNYAESNCLEITASLGCCKYPPGSDIRSYWDANKDSLLAIPNMILNGVYGIVMDAEKQPIPTAIVTVKGNDKHLTVSSRGEYWRPLPYRDGMESSYYMTVSAPGYRSVTTKRIVMKDYPTYNRLDFMLHKK